MKQLKAMFYAVDETVFNERKFLTGIICGPKAVKNMNYKAPSSRKRVNPGNTEATLKAMGQKYKRSGDVISG